MVTGSVKSTKIGFTSRFRIASTMATIIAVTYPATSTPGRNLASTTTASAVSKILKMKFISYGVSITNMQKTPEIPAFQEIEESKLLVYIVI